MKLKEFDILLDIKRNKKVEYIEIIQGDYNTNKLNIKLIDGIEDYDLVGLNSEIAFSKSDGTTVLQDKNSGINVLNNKIECMLSSNTIASPGRVLAEVRVLEGTKVLTSSRFEFFVKKAIVNDETIASTNEFPILQELTDNVKGVIATESARITAESARATNETKRVTEEGKRVTAEQNRATTFEGYETRVSTVEDDLTTHKEDYATLVDEVTELSYITQRYTVDSWQKVQDIVKAGLGSKAFRIGDSFLTTVDEQNHIVDVIGIDHDAPNSITIQFRNCIMNVQFDAIEALYYAEEELVAGNKVFAIDSGKYEFTTTIAVPQGGQVVVEGWTDYVPATATTYGADRVTVIESSVPVIASEGESNLTPVNHQQRCRYGSNNYLESTVRGWLNSDEDNYIWTPQTNYDRPSTDAPYDGAGFLKLLDPELAEVIAPTEKQVARNTATDGGGQDTFNDKVFLLSRVEIGLGSEETTDGESVYAFWNNSTNEDRIKLLGASPRTWWLRSPVVGGSHRVRFVSASGALSGDIAGIAVGLSPACTIS